MPGIGRSIPVRSGQLKRKNSTESAPKRTTLGVPIAMNISLAIGTELCPGYGEKRERSGLHLSRGT